VTASAGIGRVIEEICGILASISAATEEQSAATRDTSLRVARVSELAALRRGRDHHSRRRRSRGRGRRRAPHRRRLLPGERPPALKA
jgi:hypothetical protein